jgi:hypothetical protein
VATATLAWGVNLPARLVIVKGTEFFDGKVSRYVDYPLTDVLQVRHCVFVVCDAQAILYLLISIAVACSCFVGDNR